METGFTCRLSHPGQSRKYAPLAHHRERHFLLFVARGGQQAKILLGGMKKDRLPGCLWVGGMPTGCTVTNLSLEARVAWDHSHVALHLWSRSEAMQRDAGRGEPLTRSSSKDLGKSSMYRVSQGWACRQPTYSTISSPRHPWASVCIFGMSSQWEGSSPT